MGQTLFNIIDAPLAEASPDSLGKLDEIAKSYATVLAGVPLYGLRTYNDGTQEFSLFDLEDGEEFDSRDRSTRRDVLVMDFLSSCAGNLGLQNDLFLALCEACAEGQMSFQETFDDGYVVYSIEFTETGVSGESSSYQQDSESDEYELTAHKEFVIPAPAQKRPVNKAASKKAAAKASKGIPTARKPKH